MVHSASRESVKSGSAGDSVAFNDGLRVDLLNGHELLGLSQELGSEDADRGCSVSDFIVLDLGDVDEDFSGGIVERDGFEDGGSVVGDRDALVRGGF